MIIKELRLSNFGKFHGRNISLSDGLNIVFGENEAGKSTIYFFIELMINSINSLRNEDIKEDREKIYRYLPWDDKTAFNGEILFQHEGRDYKLIRNFLKDQEEVRLYSINEGHEEKLISDLNAFEFNTLGIKNISNISGQELVDEIQSRILNKAVTNNEELNYDGVRIQLQKKIISIKNSKSYKELRNQIESFDREAKDLNQGDTVKGLYQEREALKAEKLEQENRVKEIDQNISQNQVPKKIVDFYDLVKSNERLDAIRREMKDLEEFSDIDSKDYQAYYELKNELINKEIKFNELSENISLEDNQGLLKEHNSLLIERISDTKYLNQFIDELEYYKKLLKEEEGIKRDISDTEKKVSLLNKTNGNKQYFFELERDYYNLLDFISQVELYKKNESSDTVKNQHLDEIKALKEKRLNYRIKMSIALTFSAIFFGMLFYFETFSFILVVASVTSLLILMVFMFATLPLDYNVAKLENIRVYHERNNQMRNKELEIAEFDINRILEKYSCSNEAEFAELYKSIKIANQSRKVSVRDIELFHKRIGEINKRSEGIKRNLELRMEQCGIMEKFVLSDVDSIIAVLMENKENAHQYGAKLHRVNDLTLSYSDLISEIKAIKEKLDNRKSKYFEKYEYDEILNFKVKLKSLEEEERQLTVTKNQLSERFDRDELGQYKDQFTENLETIEGYKKKLEVKDDLMINRKAYLDKLYECGEKISDLNYKILALTKAKKNTIDKRNYKIFYENQLFEYEREIDFLKKTNDYLQITSKTINGSVYPRVMQSINSNIKMITKKYMSLQINDEMKIEVQDKEGNTTMLENLSLGTIDQVYFAIRIALVKVFSKEQDIAIVLDDAFVQYDVERFNNVMNIVNGLKEQVILMTCYHREKEYALDDTENINYIEI